MLTKKSHFFWQALPPQKLVYIGAHGAFRKFLGSVAKYGYLKIVQRGDSLGRQGVESNPWGETQFEEWVKYHMYEFCSWCELY